jgi:hypothetical protein
MTFNDAQLKDRARRTYLYSTFVRDVTRNERGYKDACQFWQTQVEQYVERSGALLVTMAELRTAFTHVDGDAPSDDMLQHLFRRLCRSDIFVSSSSSSSGGADLASPVALVPKTFLLSRADSVAKQTAPLHRHDDQSTSSWLGWAAGTAVGVIGSTWSIASSMIAASSSSASTASSNKAAATLDLAAPGDVVAKSSEFVVLSCMQQLAKQLRESFERKHSLHAGAVQRVLTINDVRELLLEQRDTNDSSSAAAAVVAATSSLTSNDNIELLIAYMCVSKLALRVDLANGQHGVKLCAASAPQTRVTAEDVSILALKNARATLQHQQAKVDVEITKCQQQAVRLFCA